MQRQPPHFLFILNRIRDACKASAHGRLPDGRSHESLRTHEAAHRTDSCRLRQADPSLSVVCLRYFNPIGAHPSGLIGEDPNGIPNNLMPFVCQTAAGIRKELQVFGDDYDTPDGTGVRDYIHVTDLISGHIAALKKAGNETRLHHPQPRHGQRNQRPRNGPPLRSVNGVSVPYRIVARRPGDVASCYADPSKAFEELAGKP